MGTFAAFQPHPSSPLFAGYLPHSTPKLINEFLSLNPKPKPQPKLYTLLFTLIFVEPNAGNEGHGLRTNVRRACTGLVSIEMAPPSGQGVGRGVVDSLNVSVATGILLHGILTKARSG